MYRLEAVRKLYWQRWSRSSLPVPKASGEKQAGALAGLCTEAGEGNDGNCSEQE